MAKEKKSKISIYLIKEEITDPRQIFRKFEDVHEVDIPSLGTFYYGESQTDSPGWINTFFGDTLDGIRGSLLSASATAVLLTPVQLPDGGQRLFAIPFGYGWTLLEPGCYEEQFGLKVALNVAKPNGVRRLNVKNMMALPKDSNEQLSKSGSIADFGIDFEQVLLQAVTAEVRDIEIPIFVKSVDGKDSVAISVNAKYTSIQPVLLSCVDKFNSNEYQAEFGLIDQASPVKNKILIGELDAELVAQMQSSATSKLWMAVPDIVQWHGLKGFAYTGFAPIFQTGNSIGLGMIC